MVSCTYVPAGMKSKSRTDAYRESACDFPWFPKMDNASRRDGVRAPAQACPPTPSLPANSGKPTDTHTASPVFNISYFFGDVKRTSRILIAFRCTHLYRPGSLPGSCGNQLCALNSLWVLYSLGRLTALLHQDEPKKTTADLACEKYARFCILFSLAPPTPVEEALAPCGTDH